MSKPPVEDNSLLAVAGEWLGFLKSIPGAGKAIARLVGGFGDAGAKIEQGIGEAGAAGMDIATAKAEDAAARIRGETKAREKMRAAFTNAAVQQLEATPEMGERALAYWAGDLVTKQSNREAVAVRALEHLRDDPPKGQQEEPEDDWLNVFGSYAEKATSTHMREHWARVLAGEVRRPGSFSYATLQMVSLLDLQLATLIRDIGRWVTHGGRVILHKKFEEGIGYRQLIALQDVGFLSAGHMTKMMADEQGIVYIVGVGYGVRATFDPGTTRNFPAALLTTSGQELFDILELEFSPEIPEALGTYLMTQGATEFTVETVEDVAAQL